MRIAPVNFSKPMNFKAGKPVFHINLEERTIDKYNSTTEASKKTGFSISIINECIKNDRQYGGSTNHLFMRDLNIKEENGELVFDKEEIKANVLKKLAQIEKRNKIAENQRYGNSSKKPAVLINTETKKFHIFPTRAEAAEALKMNPVVLSDKMDKYYIVDKNRILIDAKEILNDENKPDKTKYRPYLSLLNNY